MLRNIHKVHINERDKRSSIDHSSMTASSSRKNHLVSIKRLVWLYFLLLIFEGALRKWALPSIAGPLLFLRDPILLLIYILTFSANTFPRNKFIYAEGAIALMSLIAGAIVLRDTPQVAIYGFRANFLHLPLIFVIPKVFNLNDVRKIGYWTLFLSIPLSLLMVAQFSSASNSWLNSGAGEDSGQIASAGGHIRAAATFSYILGPVYFYGLVAAFLVNEQLGRRSYPRWLILSATLSLCMATATSGSRTLLLTLLLVVLTAVMIGFLRIGLIPKVAKMNLGLFLTVLVLSQIPIFNDATDVFNTRIDNASQAEGGNSSIIQSRVIEDFTRPFEIASDVPTFGYGLGSGTIVGSVLLGGEKGFRFGRDSERELTRHVLESGATLGFLFIIFRSSLFISIGVMSLMRARYGNSLPLLLFSVGGFPLLNGQLSQTTVLGFIVIIGGICLASMRT